MRHLVKSILVVLVLGSIATSCSKESISEESELYEQATEGDEEKKDDKPEN